MTAAAPAPTVAEVEELVLPLRKAKPVRELTQAQQTAILNRKLALAAVAEWNATIGRNTAPCIPNSQWERRCASVVAQAVASLGGINGFGGLCEWAIDRNPYYAGLAYPGRNNEEQRESWTIAAWCSQYHLERMFSKCRQDMLAAAGREPRFTFDPTRKPTPDMLPAKPGEAA